MNKKAIATTFVTDMYSFLVFAVIVIAFVILFRTSSEPTTFEIVSSQISSGTESWVNNYFRMPVQADINNDNIKENLTNAELIAWYVTTHEPKVLTREEQLNQLGQTMAGVLEPEQSYFVPPCTYGEMTVYKPDSGTVALSMKSYSLAYKIQMESTHAMDTFTRTNNYELYIPSEINSKISKIKILVTCYE